MFYLYNFLWYIGLPFVIARLFWRGRKLPAYRKRIGERLGYYQSKPIQNSIWIHAASYGETVAVEPLIKNLMKLYPDHSFVITSMTPTGSERANKTFSDKVTHVYIPYDFFGAVNRFLKHMMPCIGIIMETELWPTLLTACHRKNIPILIANARLSPRSVKQYLMVKPLMKKIFQSITCIATQSEKDAQRYQQIGAHPEQITNTGNLKFAVNPPIDMIAKGKAWRTKIGNERPVWIAASTNPGEEDIVLDAHKIIREHCPTALLLLVPRHPDRFKEVNTILQKRHTKYVTRTSGESISSDTEVVLCDTMGEMYLFYATSDIALVCGSLTPVGGHNILEPAAVNVPVLSGPHTFHAMEAHELFQQANAIRYATNADELAKDVVELFNDKKLVEQMTQNAQTVLAANQDSLQKHLAWIEGQLKGQTVSEEVAVS